MYEILGKSLGSAVHHYVGNGLGWDVEFRGETGTLRWRKDEPQPTVEQLQEALWKGNWEEVRRHRNELLVATDFYALSDVTLSAEMATYRQALRDLPASTADSKDVVWPTKP